MVSYGPWQEQFCIIANGSTRIPYTGLAVRLTILGMSCRPFSCIYASRGEIGDNDILEKREQANQNQAMHTPPKPTARAAQKLKSILLHIYRYCWTFLVLLIVILWTKSAILHFFYFCSAPLQKRVKVTSRTLLVGCLP